jgi:tRNA pseudouridine55 synthase
MPARCTIHDPVRRETDTLDAEGEVVERTDRRPPRIVIPAVLEHFTARSSRCRPHIRRSRWRGNEPMTGAGGRGSGDGDAAGHNLPLQPADFEGSKWACRVTMLGVRGTSRVCVALGFSDDPWPPGPYDPAPPLELADSILSSRMSPGHIHPLLARDIARALGTVGHVTISGGKAGPFTEAQAISLDRLNEIGRARAFTTSSCRWRRGWTTPGSATHSRQRAGGPTGPGLIGNAPPMGSTSQSWRKLRWR